jgi:hypothetical protein
MLRGKSLFERRLNRVCKKNNIKKIRIDSLENIYNFSVSAKLAVYNLLGVVMCPKMRMAFNISQNRNVLLTTASKNAVGIVCESDFIGTKTLEV